MSSESYLVIGGESHVLQNTPELYSRFSNEQERDSWGQHWSRRSSRATPRPSSRLSTSYSASSTTSLNGPSTRPTSPHSNRSLPPSKPAGPRPSFTPRRLGLARAPSCVRRSMYRALRPLWMLAYRRASRSSSSPAAREPSTTART
jgi:hypothetical protein